jgi:hypothetical protein
MKIPNSTANFFCDQPFCLLKFFIYIFYINHNPMMFAQPLFPNSAKILGVGGNQNGLLSLDYP